MQSGTKTDDSKVGTTGSSGRDEFTSRMAAETEIPWAHFAEFVRQHTHDVRNALNSLDLEIAFLQELVAGKEGLAGIGRMRAQVRAFGGRMRSLSLLFQELQPNVASIAACELFLIWKEQQAGLPKPLTVEWVDKVGTEQVSADAGMMASVFRELLANAAAFSQGGTTTASARRTGGDVVFELREPKTAALDPSGWGTPLVTTRRGGCGLGLWSARRQLDANHARITQQYAPEENALITRVFLPVCQ